MKLSIKSIMSLSAKATAEPQAVNKGGIIRQRGVPLLLFLPKFLSNPCPGLALMQDKAEWLGQTEEEGRGGLLLGGICESKQQWSCLLL